MAFNSQCPCKHGLGMDMDIIDKKNVKPLANFIGTADNNLHSQKLYGNSCQTAVPKKLIGTVYFDKSGSQHMLVNIWGGGIER